MRLGLDLVQEPTEAWNMILSIMDLGSRERHKIAEAVRLGFAWNFAHESAGGEPWDPLAPMTVGLRRHFGFAGEHPILQRTKQLKLSLVDAGHPLHYYHEEQHGGDWVMELSSLDERFPTLHAGGTTEDGHPVPARPMTVLGPESIDRLRDTVVFVFAERWARLP
jgi:hypothetical protein